MLDLVSAKSVQLQVDTKGKVWVNVDGKCELRVGIAEHIHIETPEFEQELDVFVDKAPLDAKKGKEKK